MSASSTASMPASSSTGNGTAAANPFANVPPEWATEDRGNAAIAIFWVETSIALVFLSMRLISRYMTKQVGLDDAMMTVSMMAFIALSGLITSIARDGGFRHLLFVPLENATDIALKSLIAQAVNIFAYGTSKFAVGYLILRLLPQAAKVQRRIIWAVISTTLFYNWLQIILTFVQCKPYQGAWDRSVPSVCWTEDQKLADIYIGGVYNIVVDVLLALFPMLIISKLQLNIRKKISLVVLLGLGLLAAACGSIKLTYVSSLFSSDPTWSTFDLDVWSGTELCVVIVCGSIPPSKPLWDRFFPNRRWSTLAVNTYGTEKSHITQSYNQPLRSDYEMISGSSQRGSRHL